MSDGRVENGEEDGGFSLFRNCSLDDLRFELKRLQQKYDVLERDKKILEDEKELESKSTHDGAILERLSEDLKSKNADVLKWYEAASQLGQKHRVVLRHLWLEKRALREMRAELARGAASLLSSPETLGALGELQARLRALAADGERASSALARCKEEKRSAIQLIAGILSDLKLVKQNVKEVKSAAEAELQRCYSFFSSAIAEVSEAIAKSYRFSAENSTRIRCLQAEHDALHQKHSALQIDCSMHLHRIDDLLREIFLQRESSGAEVSLLKSKTELLEAESVANKERIFCLENEKRSISNQLEQSLDQMQRLASIHEAVQAELMAAVLREQELKNDIAVHGSSKDEISTRLKRIQDKVNRMERDHSEQLVALEVELKKAREAQEMAIREKEAAKQSYEDQMRSVALEHEKEMQEWSAKYSTLEQKVERDVVNDRNIKLKYTEQENLITALKSTIAELKLQNDDTAQLNQQAKAELTKLTALLGEAEQNRLMSEAKIKSLERDVLDKAQAVGPLEREIADTKAENARLLVVIQKECQERTELLIQMTELKEHIRDNISVAQRMPSGVTGSTTYALIAPIGGLSQDKINNKIGPTDGAENVPLTSDKRLAEAISFSRRNDGDDRDDAWAQRIGRQAAAAGGRGRRGGRGHHR